MALNDFIKHINVGVVVNEIGNRRKRLLTPEQNDTLFTYALQELKACPIHIDKVVPLKFQWTLTQDEMFDIGMNTREVERQIKPVGDPDHIGILISDGNIPPGVQDVILTLAERSEEYIGADISFLPVCTVRDAKGNFMRWGRGA